MSVTTRLLDNFDFILLLVDFMEIKPWEKTLADGTLMRHIEGKWQKISSEDRYLMPKIEGQVWLALYQLLLSPHCLQKYEYTDYNKNRITKLRAHLNEVVLDQMPHLIQLQRFLEQLSFMEPPTVKKQLVLEQVNEELIEIKKFLLIFLNKRLRNYMIGFNENIKINGMISPKNKRKRF
jgi:hypothetical protein